jgi:hypothetical protein
VAVAADRTPTRPAILEFDDPEASLDADVGAALGSEVRRVRVAGVSPLSPASPRASLALLRLLREAASVGVPVNWRGPIVGGIEVSLLVHLSPPDAPDGDGVDPMQVEWQQRHRPGLCYYRLGPNFVFVKDVRRTGASARYTIETVEEFRALEAVVEVASLEPRTREVLSDLEGEGLVLRLGGWATLLPHRMRRWPVPAHEV